VNINNDLAILPSHDTQVMEVVVEGVDLLEKIRKSKTKDNEVVKTVEEMKWARVKILRDKE